MYKRQEQQHAARWTQLRPTKATANLPRLTIQPDNSIFASGDTAKRDDYVIELAPSPEPVFALRLEALPDKRLPAGGPGSTYYEGTLGDFYLTEIFAESGGTSFPFSLATATFSKNRYGKNPADAKLAIDRDVQTGWAVHGRQAERHVAVFVLKNAIPAGQSITIRMSFGRHFASSLGRFRFSATNATSRPHARSYSEHVATLLREDPQNVSSADHQLLRNTFLLNAPALSEETSRIRELNKRPTAISTLVLSERPTNHPRPTHRHHRGEYLQPQEAVDAGLPDILLQQRENRPRNRLEFARWIVSKDNPLTARVVANRHWAAIFGTGLVKTVDDFGLQGESPSHPELLDWLAVTFADSDQWSVRKLHRRIVTSATYRQDSSVNPEALSVDPGNRLLSYSPRYRLDAEVIRDQLLVAAGVFSEKRGGPPVHPMQPKGVTEVAYGNPKWEASAGEDRYRRSLYTYTKRTAPFAMFTTFDAPSGEACIARRNRSNSPLQALTLLNDVMLTDLSRQAGKQMATAPDPNPETRLKTIFQRALVRPPTNEELSTLKEFFVIQEQRFLEKPEQTIRFLNASSEQEGTENPGGNEASAADKNAQVAAWSATARAVFGLDEILNRE